MELFHKILSFQNLVEYRDYYHDMWYVISKIDTTILVSMKHFLNWKYLIQITAIVLWKLLSGVLMTAVLTQGLKLWNMHMIINIFQREIKLN